MEVYAMDVILITIIAVSSLAPRVEAQGNDRCVGGAMADASVACFKQDNLQLSEMPGIPVPVMLQYPEFETFFTYMDPGIFCDDSGKLMSAYRKATTCALNNKISCVTSSMVPDPNDFFVGMQRLCDLRQDVDPVCMKSYYNVVYDCFMYKARSLAPTFGSSPKPQCTQSDIHYDCFEVIMSRTCGRNSTRIYLEIMDKHNLVRSCKNGTEPSRPRQRYFAFQEEKTQGNAGRPVTMATKIPVALLAALAVLSAWVSGWGDDVVSKTCETLRLL